MSHIDWDIEYEVIDESRNRDRTKRQIIENNQGVIDQAIIKIISEAQQANETLDAQDVIKAVQQQVSIPGINQLYRGEILPRIHYLDGRSIDFRANRTFSLLKERAEN